MTHPTIYKKRIGNYTQDANCQGAWYLNVSDGSELDRSGNGNTLAQSAQILTSDTQPTANGTLYTGKSRDFPGTADLSLADVSVTGLDINGANAMVSIVAWVKSDASANAANYGIVTKDANLNRQYNLEVYGASEGNLQFYGGVSADGTNMVWCGTDAVNYQPGTWYHLAFVSNDTDLKIYVNGAIAIAAPIAHTTGIYNGDAKFAVGSMIGANFFDGLIDEVAVFDRELSAAEVLAICNNGISGNRGASD